MAVWKIRAGIYTPGTPAFVWIGSGLFCSCCNIKFCPMEGEGYTRVVECECGWGRVLFCPLLGKVLKEWSELRPLMVLGIMVMVFGVMRGMSSGERLMARV